MSANSAATSESHEMLNEALRAIATYWWKITIKYTQYGVVWSTTGHTGTIKVVSDSDITNHSVASPTENMKYKAQNMVDFLRALTSGLSVGNVRIGDHCIAL